MRKRERHVAAADVLDESADEDHHVADDRERDPEGGDAETGPPQAARQLRRHAAVALAAHRHVGRAAEPALLQPERDEREAEEHGRQDRGAPGVVLRAGHREEDLDGEHLEVARQHDRIAEIREAFDEAQQERIGERRAQQRPRHRAEHASARCAQRLRRLFERRAHRGQRAVQDHERDRREGEHLREREAGQAVEPARPRNAKGLRQPSRHEPRASEQHDQRQRDHERRRNDRQDRHELQQPGIALAAALDDEREHETEKRREHADDSREQRRIDRDAAARAAAQAVETPDVRGEEPLENETRRKSPLLILNRGKQRLADGEEDEDRQQRRRRR